LQQKYNENIKEMAFILHKEGNLLPRIARIVSKIHRKKFYYQTIHKLFKSEDFQKNQGKY